MKRTFAVSVLGSFIGIGLVLIGLGATGVAGAQAVAARSIAARNDASQVVAVSANTPLTSTFTYQGQLKNAGNPITDTCDFQFGLWDALSNGGQIGITQTLSAPVTAGYFAVLLNAGNPFGANPFNGDQRWLSIAARCPTGSGTFTPLAPRQQLTAAPYALFSAAPWMTSGSNLTYSNGNVGIGTTTPAHHLSIQGGPLWTSNNWSGALVARLKSFST